MFNTQTFKAKMYNLKSVIDGMINAVDGQVLDTTQALNVINNTVSKLNDEHEKEKGQG
jgi:hypothetical protein